MGVLAKSTLLPRSIELTRECVEKTHRPIGLHGVGVLLDPHPSVVAGRLLGGEQPYSSADVAGRHPGEFLRPLRGILGGQLLEQLKGGPTLHDVSIGQREGVGAGERGRHTVLCIPAVSVIVHRATAAAIPDDEGLRVSLTERGLAP